MRAIILAVAVLAFTAVNADAQTPNARVFSGGAGLILYTIKPGSTADFEMVLNKTKEALMKSEKPERKQQAASWRVYKSDQAAANGNVTYVMIIDPALKDADYVQENTAENLEIKRGVFTLMDAAAKPECILASSTSTIQTSRFASPTI